MQKTNDEETILHLAARAEKPNKELVKYLLDNKEIKQKLEARHKNGWTAMHVAAFSGNLDILKELINQGADINAENNDEETILHLAAGAQKPNIELVKHLLESKGIKQKLEAKEKNGCTAMHISAFNGNLEILKELINQCADINAKNNDEETILHLASRTEKPNIELVKHLLESKEIKQKLEAKAKDGLTAMHLAAFYGNLEILEELIKQGADINAENNAKETILHLAAGAQKPSKELIKYILENKEIKQKLEAKAKDGLTAIHLAAFVGNLEILAELIKQGADIKCSN